MKTKVIMMLSLCLLFVGKANAQWVVTDPSNLAQGIINATKNIVHTSSTATNMINNFKETVKIYEQGKKYYDALKSVNNFQLMMQDENFTIEELTTIAYGYTKLLEESNDVLKEMKNVVNITTMSLTDKERMDVVDRCYNSMKRYRNLVSYYTNKNISVSYLRARKKNDMDRVMSLYGSANERYW